MRWRHYSRHSANSEAGYTLIEALVVVIIVGVLAAIAVPGWLGFLTRQRLNESRDQTLQILRQAQNAARKDRVKQAVVFGQKDSKLQMGYTKVGSQIEILSLVSKIQNGENVPNMKEVGEETPGGAIALTAKKGTEASSGSFVVFDEKGTVHPFTFAKADGEEVSGNLPVKFSFKDAKAGNSSNAMERCVVIETLIGGMRSGDDEECR